MKNDAMEKVVMLAASMRCFIYGLLSLVPVIGIPFAMIAFLASRKAHQRERKFWNAAKPYRQLGLACAVVGGLLGACIFTLYIYETANAVYDFNGD